MHIAIDKESLAKIMLRFDKLAPTIQKRALASATNAGASELAKIVKRLAPSTISPTIKAVRRKQDRHGNPKYSVIAGRGGSDTTAANLIKDAGLGGLLKGRAKKMYESDIAYPAFWIEFGTYRRRNLTKDPYSPATFKRHPDYIRLGHTSSRLWYVKSEVAKSTYWIPPTPFMRPALLEAKATNSVNRAMARKLKTYLDKLDAKSIK